MSLLSALWKRGQARLRMKPEHRNKAALDFIDQRMELWRSVEGNKHLNDKLKAMAAARLSELASVRAILS